MMGPPPAVVTGGTGGAGAGGAGSGAASVAGCAGWAGWAGCPEPEAAGGLAVAASAVRTAETGVVTGVGTAAGWASAVAAG